MKSSGIICSESPGEWRNDTKARDEMIPDPPLSLFAAAILLASGGTLLGHIQSQKLREIFVPVLILGGLGLGSVFIPHPYQNVCVLGVIGYAAYGLTHRWKPSFQHALSLGQLALAAIFCITGLFSQNEVHVVETVFLAMTFLPLAPFHLPFVSILRTSYEAVSGLWMVVWLTMGLIQLQTLNESFPFEYSGIVNLVALGSALYASLKALGQSTLVSSLTYLTVAFLSLLWSLLSLLGVLANWTIPFGLAIGFVLGALLLGYSYVCQRYGPHGLKSLQGLGSGMPRFRSLVTVVISLAVILPIIPITSGLSSIPAGHHGEGSLFLISLVLVTVWMGSSWHLTRILDQTAFGKARTDIAHEDLQAHEVAAIYLFLVAAGLWGVLP